MPLRRIIKNVVNNYSDAQVKVREATSNDPWGPSSTLMAEIADLTYNVLAFSEIMKMLWKRLNDHGRNWRHVYKALVLLEYIIKTGSEKVAQQCRENIYTIQTLKDFQYVEDTKDYGQNIREKARQLTSLLKDSERLKNERAKALKAREKFAQNSAGVSSGPNFASTSLALTNILSYPDHSTARYSGFGSPSSWSLEGNGSSLTPIDVELEAVRPTSSGEEQLQLELAMAISKEEHEQQLKALKGDEVKLQMALKQSQLETHKSQDSTPMHGASADPWESHIREQASKQVSNRLSNGCSAFNDNFEASSWGIKNTQWVSPNKEFPNPTTKPQFQPFLEDEFEKFSSMRSKQQNTLPKNDPNLHVALNDLSLNHLISKAAHISTHATTSGTDSPSSANAKTPRGKSPKDFLGENAALVNLDNLMCPEKVTVPFNASPMKVPPNTEEPPIHTNLLNPFLSSPFTPNQFVVQTGVVQMKHEKTPSFIPCNTLHPSQQAFPAINQSYPSSPNFTSDLNQSTLSSISNVSQSQTTTSYPTEFNPFL